MNQKIELQREIGILSNGLKSNDESYGTTSSCSASSDYKSIFDALNDPVSDASISLNKF